MHVNVWIHKTRVVAAYMTCMTNDCLRFQNAVSKLLVSLENTYTTLCRSSIHRSDLRDQFFFHAAWFEYWAKLSHIYAAREARHLISSSETTPVSLILDIKIWQTLPPALASCYSHPWPDAIIVPVVYTNVCVPTPYASIVSWFARPAKSASKTR